MLNLELLESVARIAREAAAGILDVYETDFTVETKTDESPVTQADLAAHRIIAQGLSALAPEIPILSEEGSHPPLAVRRHWPRHWLVDPLDGTREFVKRNGEFTVNIALIEHGEPLLGVVLIPTQGRTYAAARGLGAYVEDASGHRVIAVRATPPVPVIAVSRSHGNAALQALLARLPPHETITCGSSMKFCLLAEGRADLYLHTGHTSEWDTAAGQCVAEQAGARVLSLPDLVPLRYNARAGLQNPGFAVFGDERFGWPERLRAAL